MRNPRELEQTRPLPAERARGLVSSRASGRRVSAGAFEAGPALHGVVEKLWWGAWDLRGQAPHVTELLSDPCVHLVFETDQPPRLVGVWSKLWVRELSARGQVRAIKLRPGAARAFLDVPAHTVRNRQVRLADHLPVTDALIAAVLGPDDVREGLVALEQWASQQRRVDDDGRIAQAVALTARCMTDPALLTAEGLAEVAGLSLRALQRLFREHVGVTPKWVIRRARLQEVAAQTEQTEVSLTELAYALGYADQAHLARDFKQATGKTLSALRRAAVEADAVIDRGAA